MCILALLGCATPGPGAASSGDDPCKDVDLAVEKVWSASIKAEVMGYGGGAGAEQRQKIANQMDAVSEDWVRLRRSVCRDHLVRKVITAEDYRTQVKCFDDRLDQQRKLVTLLKGGNTSEAATVAESLMGAPNACR